MEINKKLTRGYYATAGLITSCASINHIVNTMNRAGSREKTQLSESINLVLFLRQPKHLINWRLFTCTLLS